MQLGGVSIRGKYHQVNQDSFISCAFKDGYVLAVADGLGSKAHSEKGSLKLCESVIDLASTCIDFSDTEKYLEKLHKIWLEKLTDEDINECYTTALLCIIVSHKIFIARLGDGFISLITDKENAVLHDSKEEYFTNMTDCMANHFTYDLWDYKILDNKGFKGVIACTDGIGIHPETEEGYLSFSKDFIEEYKKSVSDIINKDIGIWLDSWPGYDDKTIGYIIQDEV